jgi:TonB family protein
VLDQTLPQVSAKALSTINGTVRVVVKAHVDEAGQVTDAQLQEPGPSQYFADKAVQAAQRWVFSSPEVHGHSAASDWLIRFEYTQDGVRAFPQEVTP